MTSSRNRLQQDFMLTPQQQSLLFAALNSNRQNGSPSNNGGLTLSPSTFTQASPTGKGAADPNAFQDSPYLDYDYSFDGGDTSFDDSFLDNINENGGPKMIGDLPSAAGQPKSGSSSSIEGNDSPEKRSHPDDDAEEEAGNGAKRRESTEKVPKKPGRKPLTSEPTSKRKAQNRAAQRAFRERKEKHVKDLEIKVEELEKASQAASNENGTLRGQVERLTMELNEYKKRLNLMTSNRSQASAATRPATWGNPMVNNINDVNFQFEFPTFGALPTPPTTNGANGPSRSSSASKSSSQINSPSSQTSPQTQDSRRESATPGSSYSVGLDAQTKEDLAKFSGIFSPPLTNTNVAKASGDSLDSQFGAGGASTSSPSACSSSNMGQSSSCGTSPEPFTQSPMGFKPVDTLATIGEEDSSLQNQDYGHFSSINMNDIDWLAASATNFQFDPQVFGGYRDPQENVGNNVLGDNFFNDAWDVDFTTPFNTAPVTAVTPKKDLIAQIDAAKEADDEVGKNGELLTCNKIWEQLQNCPKVQNGDFDLDGLCSELQKKAKCSGHGAVVDEKDFRNVMTKYLGKTDDGEAAKCLMGAKGANPTST